VKKRCIKYGGNYDESYINQFLQYDLNEDRHDDGIRSSMTLTLKVKLMNFTSLLEICSFWLKC
jgi:hypothetical protein